MRLDRKKLKGLEFEFSAYIIAVRETPKILDPDTGEPIQEFVTAKSNCSRCHGRGFIGWKNGKPDTVCSCLIRRVERAREKNKWKRREIKYVTIEMHKKTEPKNRVIHPFRHGEGIIKDLGPA